MSTSAADLQRQLESLPPEEQDAILVWLRRKRQPSESASLGVEKTPGVCGGRACIVRTRIPVWTLEAFRRHGHTDSQLLESYPSLRAEDLVNAWMYVAAHRDEIERDIADNEAD
jgi:uncharacterized protein (DUF433 family)